MAKKLVRLLRVERPDYQYLKKVFQHTRSILAISPAKMQKRLPELLTDHELVGFYEAVWQKVGLQLQGVRFDPVTGEGRDAFIEQRPKRLSVWHLG